MLVFRCYEVAVPFGIFFTFFFSVMLVAVFFVSGVAAVGKAFEPFG